MKRLKIVVAIALVLGVGGLAFAGALTLEKKPGSNKFTYVDVAAAANGQVFYVDSGSATASDATNYGYHPDVPFATVDYAVGQCTANNGCVIYVMPGHNETCAAGCVDADVAGVSIIGLGTGQDRPRFDYDANTGTFLIGAASVTVRNLTFMPGVTATVTGIVVESGGDNAIIQDCEFLVGEAAGTDEFISAITVNGGANDVWIIDNIFQTDPADASCTNAINLGVTGAAIERPVIARNQIYGNYSTAAIIDGGTAFTEGWIVDNRMKVKNGEPGIELAAASTAVIANNQIESTGVTCAAAIVSAAGAWFNNECVTTDGTAAVEIGGSLTPVYVECVVLQSTVVAAGINLTAASSGGDLWLEDVVVMNGATVWNSAGNAAVFEMYSTNLDGAGSFMVSTEAQLEVANVVVDLESAVTAGKRMVLESGKLIKLKATTEDFTSDGLSTLYFKFIPMAAGATVAAGTGCQ